MAERPILFSGPMVRAIMDGTKTQTRRVVKFDAASFTDPFVTFGAGHSGLGAYVHESEYADEGSLFVPCPYGVPGDTLWVRETWRPGRGLAVVASPRALRAPAGAALAPGIIYAADGATLPAGCRWRPSIHMPRWASRLTLLVKSVRVERLQEISTEDATAEGLPNGCFDERCTDPRCRARARFEGAWDTINGKRAPWASNPWVWVVEFERHA